jgi:hypothetical protein
MRQTMETVPRDGTVVILENDALGSFELAHWSVDDDAWLSEEGKLCSLVPTFWHALQRSSETEGLKASASPDPKSYAMVMACAQAKAQQLEAPARGNEGLEVSTNTMPQKATREGRRFAGLSVGIILVLVSMLGVHYRSEITSYARRFVPLPSEGRLADSLPPPHTENYLSNLNAAQSSIAELSVLLSQERARIAELETELKKTRRDLVVQAIRVIEKDDEVRQAASTVNDLKQALAREAAKTLAVPNEFGNTTGAIPLSRH